MSTPNVKLRRTQKRKGAVSATSAAAPDDSSSIAASRSSDDTGQELTVSPNCNDNILVNKKRDPKAGAATDGLIVLDDLPDVIPVTGPELEVIEIYLGSLIDRLLKDAASGEDVTRDSPSKPGLPNRASALDRD